MTQIQNGTLALGGTSGNDTFVLTPGGTTATQNNISVLLNNVNLGMFAPSTGTVLLYGGNGTASSGDTDTDAVTINGTALNDTFTVNGNTVTLNTTLATFTVSLSGVEATMLNGQGGSNQFTFTGTGLGAVTKITGGTGANTLTAPDVANTWTITGTNRGTLDGVAFTGIANLVGGAGNDLFQFNSSGAISGTLDAKGGSNTLDYKAYTSSVVVDLPLQIATGTGGIRNIQNISVGSSNSVLVGDAANNVFSVLGGRNLLIGGAGRDQLVGGSGEDILIGGTTSYDNNIAALDALLAYWSRTDLTYAQRVAGLSTTGTSYTDGTGTHTAVLNGTTVFDDKAVDTLIGGTGLDWFFAHTAGTNKDVIHHKKSGETVTAV